LRAGFGFAALAGQGWGVEVIFLEIIIFWVFAVVARWLGGASELVERFGLSCGFCAIAAAEFFWVF
jgi:hypothetical protein